MLPRYLLYNCTSTVNEGHSGVIFEVEFPWWSTRGGVYAVYAHTLYHPLGPPRAMTVGSGNAIAAAVAGTGVIGTIATAATSPQTAIPFYMAASVASYCWRRGRLHKWPSGIPLGAAEVFRRHVQYERDWHAESGSVLHGRMLHLAHVAAWLLAFQPLYPLLELALLPCDLASFWFYYPKARGCGLIIDLREKRRQGARGNRAQLIRLDWPRFEINVGKAYPPPNSGRHPPSVLCNLPHIDLPQRSLRHWPWRQHTDSLLWLLPSAR